MYKGGGDHQDVEDLVRLEPEVAFAGEEPLRYPGGVETGPEDVEAGLDEDPVHGGLRHGVGPARHDQRVTRGDDAEQAETDKHQSSHGSEKNNLN